MVNHHTLAAYLRAQIEAGSVYCYGVTLVKFTRSVYTGKKRQYPAHYTAARANTYERYIAEERIAADCVNSVKGAIWTQCGTTPRKYAGYGCPDQSANGMYAYARSKGLPNGAIATLPEIPGIALHKAGHHGTYLGNGLVAEWASFSKGARISRLADVKWLNWYYMPGVDYRDAAGEETPAPAEATLGSRLLRRGMTGADVRELQTLLLAQGYNLGAFGPNKDGIDGEYGSKTEAAVRAFQRLRKLTVDGLYGERTHASLMDLRAEETEADEPATEQPAAETTHPARIVTQNGGRVNIRAGAGTQHRILTVVATGTRLRATGRTDNGWVLIDLGDRIGFVYGQYIEMEETAS